MASGWNTQARAVRDARGLTPGWNVGLLHAWSATCAIDVDDYVQARGLLEGHGINLDALLAADDAVQIQSGRKGRAKLLYQVPDGVDPLGLPHVSAGAAGGGKKWLELRCATRCGTKTMQDILPPSIHPDTGRPYAWHGDWRHLPKLPAEVLALWRKLGETTGQRKARGIVGPGTSAEVQDACRRLEAAGLKPYWTGHGYRSHCPHHGGESGTTLSVDEGGNGKALFHCFAGCTQQQVLDALNAKAPRDHGIATGSAKDQEQRAQDARESAAVPAGRVILPDLPAELLALPGGLGELQQWVLGFMSHPSPAAAGFSALATLSHFAMAHVGVASRDGLGLNEHYLLLAHTGFGKEDLRKPIRKLSEALAEHLPPTAGNLARKRLPEILENAPASLQGMHSALEINRAHTFMPDEFGEWLAHSAKDGHKQQAASYAMQAYSKAYGTLEAPAVSTHGTARPYVPIKQPRVLIFATSTSERLLEAVTASQADSGALNRFVILIAEQERIAKRYGIRPEDYRPPQGVVDLVAWVAALPEGLIELEPDAWAFHDAHDAAVLEDLKFRDNRLAGRLNEQALKIAGLIALGDRRLQVSVRDLAIAYAIREGLYHRAASLVGYDGALSGMHATGRALEQIRQHLVDKPFIYRSNLRKLSRKFAALSIPEQEAVLRAVQVEGFARFERGRLVSEIHEGKAP